MITVGVDAHKRLHVAVAVDDAGHEVGRWSGPNTPRSWSAFSCWLGEMGEKRHIGVEGAWGYGRGLAR